MLRLATRKRFLKFKLISPGFRDCVTECMSRRPQTSTLFRLLGLALKSRGICENTSMPHEGELPGWIEDYAKQCMEILQESHKIL